MRILIAGGYGLVGGLVARHVRAAGHDVELILAGRRPEEGAALAAQLGARAVRLDVADPEPGLAAAGPVDLVVAALQDPGDALLSTTLRAGAAHIGIVRTAETMASSAIAVCAAAPARPALMLGHWQAGVLTLAAQGAARAFDTVEAVALAALYDYADPIGPMTAGDSEGFVGRALIRRDGIWTSVNAAEAGRRVARRGQDDFDAMPMGVLDVPALAAVTGARDVRFDLGTGESMGTQAGRAASHDLFIDITGEAGGEVVTRRTLVTDPRGQAHLTALGVLVGVERILNLDGAGPARGGLAFPESFLDAPTALARFEAFGVVIETQDLP
ncbi:hypothetical protein [Phenylobacterium sp.]|uniref:hypothetical protein n=1 Tax=Phenylobacterium sp. TaxID=1871053 RepID=UPI0027364747|nr:hypothetical protein [Phenylobacterium sp.]MDP3854158.1 hypothetical protein [Phenylobacterium sp.]